VERFANKKQTPEIEFGGLFSWEMVDSSIGGGAAMHSEALGLLLLEAVAFCILGPYSLLAGAIALKLGGRRGIATAAGLIDTAGFLGAVLSGAAIGAVAQRGGWSGACRLLSVVTALSAVACLLCWRERRFEESPTVLSARERAHAR
jgi:sugar phosphate permease